MDRICYSLLESSSSHVCSTDSINDWNKSTQSSQVSNHELSMTVTVKRGCKGNYILSYSVGTT